MASPEIQHLKFSGAVLAGGLSRRMGTDKALITVNGETLVTRHVRLLRAAGAIEVLLSQHPTRPRPDFELPGEVRLVWDSPNHLEAGPLAGLAAVLEAATSDLVAVVAVDLPTLTIRWWRQLLTHATTERGVVGQRPDGFFEPLAALYPRRALAVALERLAAGDFAVQALVCEGVTAGWMRALPMNDTDQAELCNWNSDCQLLPRPITGR